MQPKAGSKPGKCRGQKTEDGFNVKVPMLSWSGMTYKQLKRYYDKLVEEPEIREKFPAPDWV